MAALLSLLPYALWALAIGMAFCIKGVNHAVFALLIKVFGPIPGVHDALVSAENSVAHAINVAFGAVYNQLDKGIGIANHVMAEAWDELWKEIRTHAGLLAAGFPLVELAVWAIHQLQRHVHFLQSSHTSISADVKKLTKEYKGIEAGVKHLNKEIPKGIGNDLGKTLPNLKTAWDDFSGKVLPGIESEVARIPKGAIATEKWVQDNALVVGTSALAGAVAWALSRLGLNSIQCNGLKNLFNKRGCGLWSALDDILGLLVDGLVLVDLCHLLPEAEALFAQFEGPLVTLISDAANAVCAQPPESFAVPNVSPATLPPPQTLGQLAA